MRPAAGHNWNDPAFASTHNRPQTLEAESKGHRVTLLNRQPSQPSDISSCGAAAHELLTTLTMARDGTFREASTTSTSQRPAWLSLDGTVLRFFGYFVERVNESPTEAIRYRRVAISYFPVDDTILIQEPRVPNSGMEAGTILKRQRVPKGEEFVSLDDFKVGQDLVLFNRHYRLYDADGFTKLFLSELGVEVVPGEAPPEDTFRAPRREEPKPGMERTRRISEDVMCFKAYWDCRSEGSSIRIFDVKFFCEDSTISINERYAPNSTSEAIPKTFLSRRRIPCDGNTSKAAELTFSARINGVKEAYLGPGPRYYSLGDLTIGATLHVYGRALVLYECDAHTREFFSYQGKEQPANIAIDGMFAKPAPKSAPIPPPTGFGSHDDSMASCGSLILKPPKRKNANITDAQGKILRFKLKLHKPDRVEELVRTFLLSYFVDDGEISVNEIPQRNTGYTGGKFLAKGRAPRTPDGEETGDFYTLGDIFIGAVLKIGGFAMEVVEMDKFTENFVKYAETNGRPPEDLKMVSLDRLRQLIASFEQFLTVRFYNLTEAFRAFDKDHDGYISLAEFGESLTGYQITSRIEEAVALLLVFDLTGNGCISHADFVKCASSKIHIPGSDVVNVGESQERILETSHIRGSHVLRDAVLKKFRERLDNRCMNGFEMFRLISTMPRSIREKRATLATLSNPAKDTVFTPVQLRLAVQDALGLLMSQNELSILLGYFFPALPVSQYNSVADTTFEHVVDLKSFHEKLVEMGSIRQLH